MSTYRFARPDRAQSNLSNVVNDTKKQAFLYIGSFVLSNVFTAIMLILEIFDLPAPFSLSLFQAIFSPLQGTYVCSKCIAIYHIIYNYYAIN
jgi:hypothetical protein